MITDGLIKLLKEHNFNNSDMFSLTYQKLNFVTVLNGEKLVFKIVTVLMVTRTHWIKFARDCFYLTFYIYSTSNMVKIAKNEKPKILKPIFLKETMTD